MIENPKIAIIGLGYVGLPLALSFGQSVPTVGFDISQDRVAELNRQEDRTKETEPAAFHAARHLSFTAETADLADRNVYIITVPTPIDGAKQPDLRALISASETVGQVLSRGDIVIYESTVYPGATEEICVPVLERISGLTFNADFYAGYSPERINPGDKNRRLENIVKLTSGSTPEAADFVNGLYGNIVTAGTHQTESIRVAEAAKVIENTQRDLNIALINELAIIFSKMGLDTEDVLRAAETKWNFLSFRPGLVGGHCIGVDPYYLTHKAQSIGYHPQIILAGRRLNDGMGAYVAQQLIKTILQRQLNTGRARILIMGLAFKENCPDIRNTRVVDVVHALTDFGLDVDVYDPLVDPDEALREYGLKIITDPPKDTYLGIVLAVGHSVFRDMSVDALRAYGTQDHILYDLKYILEPDASDLRL